MISAEFVEGSNTIVEPSSGERIHDLAEDVAERDERNEVPERIHFSYSMIRIDTAFEWLDGYMACARTTPRGSAVVPEVNRISAMCERVSGSSARFS